MKHYMIIMQTLEQSYCFMKFKQFPHNECILLSASMPDLREKLMGYYDSVMDDEIELFGVTKEQLAKIYLEGSNTLYDEYKRTHGFIKRELKASSLANKKLKIIKGYLQGCEIVIEDWWERISGEKWKVSAFYNPAAYNYCFYHQSEYENRDKSVNWVLYGKIKSLGYLVNVNELELPKDYKPEEDYILMEVKQ